MCVYANFEKHDYKIFITVRQVIAGISAKTYNI